MTDLFYPIYPRVLGQRSEFFVLDGGFSTQLSSHVPSESFEGRPLWTSEANSENPSAVIQTHKDFLTIGSADLISSNSYQAAVSGIERAVELVDEAILSASNVPRKAGVVGSLGPYAAILPSGSEYKIQSESYPPDMSDEELKAWHRERVKHLMIAGVDVIAFETFPCIKEALLALDVIDNVVNAKCWVSFQCRDAQRLAGGESFKEAVNLLLRHPAFVKRKLLYVGVNCTSPRFIAPLLKLAEQVNRKENFPNMHGYWRIPYVVYPNWGVFSKKANAYILDKGDKFNGDEAILQRCKEWMRLGARIIGGCCGVNACLIRTIKSQVAEHILGVLDQENEPGYFVDHDIIESRLLKPVEKNRTERRNVSSDFTDSLWTFCELPYKNSGWANEQ